MEEVSGREPGFNCNDVVIREILTIGGLEDDYEKWRHQELSHIPPEFGLRAGRSE
jgi:hypothetical protein